MNELPTTRLFADIANPAAGIRPPEPRPSDGARLLIVGDETGTRSSLFASLSDAGCSVTGADQGAEALTLLANNPFDLVLLDLAPGDRAGIELLSRLRSAPETAKMPVIVMTPGIESGDIVRCLDAGADDCIVKPVDVPEAFARIRSQLARRRAGADIRHSEERLALAVAGSNDGMWDWDLDADNLYLSERWFDIVGLRMPSQDVAPSVWIDRIHAEDRQRVMNELRNTLDGISHTLASEHRLRHDNGTYRWVLVRGVAARTPDGEPRRIAGSMTDITDRKAVDRLTGLPNRAPLAERIDRCLARARRNPDQIGALFVMNIDGVGLINEGYGEPFGDMVLKTVAARLTNTLRPTDIVAALGGDEFAVFVDRIDDPANALSIGRRLQAVIGEQIAGNDRKINLSVGIGIAVTSDHHGSGADLISEAFAALNRAKRSGKGGIALFDEDMQTAAAFRLDLEQEIRVALESDQFRLAYQPIIALSSGRISGFEGLVRWYHPARGIVSPADFIPVAEESGLIVSMTELLLGLAVETAAGWRRTYADGHDFYVSVNLSARDIESDELVTMIQDLLTRWELPPSCLKLEVTESQMMRDIDSARRTLEQFREVGVSLALDDFGTGHSSLSYLTRLPFDTLKVDRSFIDKVDRQADKQKILQAIIALGRSLEMTIVGEGVETRAEHDLLASYGCDDGQGYFYARPVAPDDLADILGAWKIDLPEG